jgi:hypothetical protein
LGVVLSTADFADLSQSGVGRRLVQCEFDEVDAGGWAVGDAFAADDFAFCGTVVVGGTVYFGVDGCTVTLPDRHYWLSERRLEKSKKRSEDSENPTNPRTWNSGSSTARLTRR